MERDSTAPLPGSIKIRQVIMTLRKGQVYYRLVEMVSQYIQPDSSKIIENSFLKDSFYKILKN